MVRQVLLERLPYLFCYTIYCQKVTYISHFEKFFLKNQQNQYICIIIMSII